MRLSDFITDRMEAILAEWEAFAATLQPAAREMSSLALRDHAQSILQAIAQDLTISQTRDAESRKSRGQAPQDPNAPDTAAKVHAVLRAQSGFDINQLVAEYRALRASVLRLWLHDHPVESGALSDVVRFNESIDQAIAESVGCFHQAVEGYRNLLLGMLGHDMRSPLNCIVMTASSLAELNAGVEVSDAAAALIRSGASMQALLDDLVDFNRTNLGLGLKIATEELDLAKVADDELRQLRAANPKQAIEFSTDGNIHGRWDGKRVQQVVRNLVSNAICYGSPNMPVHVSVRGDQPTVRIEVSNVGAIEQHNLSNIFDPLHRGTAELKQPRSDGLGLGLFIVREIARAHGGDVEVSSENRKTTFAVRLPRKPVSKQVDA